VTQEQLAASVGVHGNTIARQERGEIGIGEPLARLVLLLVAEPRLLRKLTTPKRRGRKGGP
jgi:hypothetical protein